MPRFDEIRAILKNHKREIESLASRKGVEIQSAKSRFRDSALPEEIKCINSEYSGLFESTRKRSIEKLDAAVSAMRVRNSGKFLPNYINTTVLERLNLIAGAGIPLTEGELEDIAKDALKSKSDFCCRKAIDVAKKSGFSLRLPNEAAANRVIDEMYGRTKRIIEEYNGITSFNNRTSGADISIKIDSNGRYLDALEQKYCDSMLEDITISNIPKAEYEKKQKNNDEEMVEVVEAGELNIQTKSNDSKSSAVQYARDYSARMNQKTEPED